MKKHVKTKKPVSKRKPTTKLTAVLPSDLPKDLKIGLRMNEGLKNSLKKKKLSPQKVFDQAINKIFKTSIKVG